MCVRVASLFAGLELNKLGLMAWLSPAFFLNPPLIWVVWHKVSVAQTVLGELTR